MQMKYFLPSRSYFSEIKKEYMDYVYCSQLTRDMCRALSNGHNNLKHMHVC